jgi:putative phage-type endonuclease
MNLFELDDLEDILDKLVFEDEPTLFTEEYTIQFVETALKLMYEYMILNPQIIFQPDFYTILLEEITDIFYAQMEEYIDDINNGDDFEDDMNELLQDACNIFIVSFYPEINFKKENILDNDKNDINDINDIDNDKNDIDNDKQKINIEKKINFLRSIPQPTQRTPEWYKFRWNLITASNAWKAFESQSAINQLIYEKCKPIITINKLDDNNDTKKMINTNSPLHHGQKYEPVTVLIYERNYKTKVEDFGCIQHSVYKFLGASPDGIIVNHDSNRYGRMLEIKNVVSREITGIPKNEYWVQMQLQMEVCDLDDCDFVETKFIEYPDRQSYEDDCKNSDDNNNYDETISVNGKEKGVIIQFYTKEGDPFYCYKPLNIKDHESILKWEDETISLYESEEYKYIFMKFIYWKLEKISCILVLRNREWFKNNIDQIEKVWNIIEKERITGYEHRAPNKKFKFDPIIPVINSNNNNNNNLSKGCFLFDKIKKLDVSPPL